MLGRSTSKSKFKYFAASMGICCGIYLATNLSIYNSHNYTMDKGNNQSLGTLYIDGSVWSSGRHLLGLHRHPPKPNCTPPAILEFPNDFMNNDQRLKGGFLICVAVSLYMFWAIAIICDDYFLPALDVICERLNLQSDVAGATFMALGSSAPELFASLIGVFITEGDIGTSTILGSAVFNVLFVIGICGVLSGQVLKLSWWPLVRDLMSYLFALVTLILVIMDDVVMWYEAIIMMCFYSFYLILMYFNPKLETFMYRITNTEKKAQTTEHELGYTGLAPARELGEDETLCGMYRHHSEEDEDNVNESLENQHDACQVMKEDEKEGTVEYKSEGILQDNQEHRDAEDLRSYEIKENDVEENLLTPEKGAGKGDNCSTDDDSEFDVALGSPLSPPKGKWKKICWSLALPLSLCFYFTIPDVRKSTCRKWYPLTFMFCIIWIALTSYVLVWMVTIIGFTFGMPDTVMGLTLVAFGSSVPDCLSSLFVARKGNGDMACSHTVGSNVFDILLCLGIPWTVKTTIFETRSSIVLNSHGLFISSFFIMASILVTFLMMHFYEWKLTKKVGYTYLCVYLIFISIACIIELNVFGYFNPPMCKVDGSV